MKNRMGPRIDMCWCEEFAVDEHPGQENHDLQVEEHEEEGREVELDREPRVDDPLAGDAALIGGVLMRVCLARWPSRWLVPMMTAVIEAARAAWITKGRYAADAILGSRACSRTLPETRRLYPARP